MTNKTSLLYSFIVVIGVTVFVSRTPVQKKKRDTYTKVTLFLSHKVKKFNRKDPSPYRRQILQALLPFSFPP